MIILYIFLYFLLFMYFSIGMIIGLKITRHFDKKIQKVGIVLFKIIFWLPNIPADIIVGHMEVK